MTRRGVLLAVAALAAAVLTPGSAQASGFTVARNVVYARPGGHPLAMDVYVPSGNGPFPAVEVLHPGGFTTGDKADPKLVFVAEALANGGYVAFSVNYRLSPAFTFPAPVQDAQAAVRFARANAARFHIDPHRVGVFGASAGGTVAASVAYSGSGPLDQGSRVAAAAMWSPPLDLNAVARSNGMAMRAIAKYVCGFRRGAGGQGCPSSAVQNASPLRSLSGTEPPSFVAGGRDDTLVQLGPLEGAVATLRRAGVSVAMFVAPHGHALDYRTAAIGPTIAFFNTHLRTFQPGPTPSAATAHPSPSFPPSTAPPSPSPSRSASSSGLLAVVVGVIVGVGALAVLWTVVARAWRNRSFRRS